MQIFTFLPVLLTLLLTTVSQVSSYSFKGNKITDLDGEGQSFVADSALWIYLSPINNSSQKYFVCGSKYLFGAENRRLPSVRRIYEGLPPHNIIYFSIKISLIDKWMISDNFILNFNPGSYATGVLVTKYDEFQQNTCGDPKTNDLDLTFSGKVIHKDDTLNLDVLTETRTTSNFRSFGFREITLLFRNASKEEHPLNPYRLSTVLEACSQASIPLRNGQCNCSEGQYQSRIDGTCQPCHPLCKTCLGPSPSQCLDCKDTAFFDGIECSACHSSCVTCSGSSLGECRSCSSKYYLFEGKSCVESCNAPLIPTIRGTVKYCSIPCPGDQFFFSNGTCSSSCDSNHNSITWNGVKFCADYCPSGKYFVATQESANGACLDVCPEGHYVNDITRYCLPCQDSLCSSCPINNGTTCEQCKAGYILDTDGVCKECTSLNVMYLKALDTGHQYKVDVLPKFCNLKAFTLQHDLAATLAQPNQGGFPPYTFHITPYTKTNTPNSYLVDLVLEGSVLETSDINLKLHHLSGVMIVPKTFVPSLELQSVAEYTPVAGILITSVIAVSFLGAVALESTAIIWSIINFQQFISYFAFINVAFPFQAKMFFSLLRPSTWDFLPNPLQSVTQFLYDSLIRNGELTNPESQPPQKFMENDTSSAFIKNGGGILLSNILLVALLVIVGLVKKKVKSLKKNRILKFIKSSLRWNVISRTYLENCVPLLLATLLQLRTLNFSYLYLIFSSTLSLFALIYCVITFILLTKVLYNSSSTELKKDLTKRNYSTLTKGILLDTPASKYYHIIILLRGALLVFLVVFFEEMPAVQIFPLIIFNLGLIYYLFKQVKFEDRNLDLINRVKEILIMIGEVLVLGVVFQGGSEQFYNVLGWLIVGCFVSALLMELSYMVWLQIKGLKEIKSKVVVVWNLVRGGLNTKEATQKSRQDRQRRVSPQKYNDTQIMITTKDKIDTNSSYGDNSFN